MGVCSPQKGGDKLGYESEAFAIYDTMRYIKPPIGTVCVGSAFGEAGMLLAAGEPVSYGQQTTHCAGYEHVYLFIQIPMAEYPGQILVTWSSTILR